MLLTEDFKLVERVRAKISTVDCDIRTIEILLCKL